MLQRLQEKNYIPTQDSRTDGEYEQLVQQLQKPQPYTQLLSMHQQLYFGGTAASAELWEAAQRAYQEIEQSWTIMKPSNRRLILVFAIAIIVIILLTLIFAPSNDRLTSGSTYSRNPNGYGAWYEFMTQKNVAIQRWEKPLSEFIDWWKEKEEQAA